MYIFDIFDNMPVILFVDICTCSLVDEMSLSGGIEAMVRLIGKISNPSVHGTLLSSITQAILHDDKFSSACELARIQHRIIKCLEQGSNPLIQVQAAECMAKLTLQKESLREGCENKSSISTICDMLKTTTSDQIQCYMCQTLSALLKDQRTCDIIQEENVVNTVSQLMIESTHHNTQEAAIQFLSSLSLWDSAHKKIKKDSVISSIMQFMKIALCNTCLLYGVRLYHYLSDANGKNKTLLLEKHIFEVLRRLMSLDIDSATKKLCDELQSSLAVRTPQQDLTPSNTASNKRLLQYQPANEQGLVMPPVSWSQSSYKVRVTVNVPGSRREDFIIDEGCIQFKAQLENKNYGFDLELFDKIKTATSSIDIIGNRAQLVLNKCEKGMWSRLLKQKHKTSIISRDHERMVNSSDSENSDENIPILVKGKKSRLPKTCPEKKIKSPYVAYNDDSDTSEDSLLLDSEEEKMEEDDFIFYGFNK